MLYARYRLGEREAYGLVEGDGVHPVEGDIFGEHRPLAKTIPLTEITLLAPVRPGKILAAAINYHSHEASSTALLGVPRRSDHPQLFLKPPSAVIGPGEAIVLPAVGGRVECEGEVVAVIGRRCRNVSPGEALGYVFGYTCGNDVSMRDWQRNDLQWWRAKGADTFAPIGPYIAAGLDASNLQLVTRVNGVEKQRTSTSYLIFSVAELVSHASQAMTLEPGDLIFTGTPGETPEITAGDVVEVDVADIGALRNPVAVK